jgi:chromosomal replication initiation ATPase DnaA
VSAAVLPAKPRQMPLELLHQAGFSRDELVVTPANQAAVTLVDSWPQWPASLMVLAGPPGSGKSHLAAIWAEKARAQVMQGDALAIAKSDTNILIDGLGEAVIDETALFHVINDAREQGNSMLITSRRWPSQWPVKLPDLISRIKSAPTVEISEPDDALLSGVITKLFADRQLVVEPQLVSYLVSRIERSLATAQNVVERLDKAALEAKTRITRQMAGIVLTELDFGQKSFDL